MCTVVILRRPNHDWPLILAANRDEMKTRPWLPPGRHWPERPEVVAGLDQEAGGTWLGLNDHGLLAGVLNRRGSLGPQTGKRSRGELVLEALDHAEAEQAAIALSHLDPEAYRPFNLVVADRYRAFWLRNLGADNGEGISLIEVGPGLSMLTARDLNDGSSPRIETYLPRFRTAAPPDPGSGDWQSWEALLASRLGSEAGDPMGAMTVVTDLDFETVSSSLIALPSQPEFQDPNPRKPIWRFAPGRPDRVEFAPVEG